MGKTDLFAVYHKGVIMDVTTPEQAKTEAAGAAAVMALTCSCRYSSLRWRPEWRSDVVYLDAVSIL